MIKFINLQELLFSASATETRAARTGRKNRHEAVTFPAFIAGAEPAGESRCVGKTARLWRIGDFRLMIADFYCRTMTTRRVGSDGKGSVDKPCPERTNGNCADRCNSVLNSDTAERRGTFTEGSLPVLKRLAGFLDRKAGMHATPCRTVLQQRTVQPR